MFEDSIYKDDNILLQTIRLNRSLDMADKFTAWTEVGKQYIDQNFSKTSIARNDITTQRHNFFHKEFPKKATSLDTEEHYVDIPGDFLVRWFPRDIAKMIFPALYFQDIIQQLKKQKCPNSIILVEFTAAPVPTFNEESACKEINGTGFWNRDGIWICTCSKVRFDETDNLGKQFFKSYNEWLIWDSHRE